MTAGPTDPRRQLPSVESVVAEAERLLDDHPGTARGVLLQLARARLSEKREAIEPAGGLASELAEEARLLLDGTIRPVINATGVLLQTNLGRAPLSAAALARVAAVGSGYAAIEYDLDRGARGERANALARTFKALLGVTAIVVNNNAASLVLSLFTLARGKEVVVSRGELIEIGGSFRLPDVMRLTGARLVEVGTTNRTRIADYKEALTPRTAMLLKVHTSNFQVLGFTEAAPMTELAELAHDAGLVAMEDLGSGTMLATEAAGLRHEPTVQDALAAGADMVAFSGDKLLGGPQAGIVAGRPELVRKLARSPLYRAVRPDKLTLAAMEATLGAYLRGTPEELPVWEMIGKQPAAMRAQAAAWAERLQAGEVVSLESAVGGGSLPGQTMAGFGLAVGTPGARPSAATIAARLRRGDPPVIARIREGRVLLDPRTVLRGQDAALVAALQSAVR